MMLHLKGWKWRPHLTKLDLQYSFNNAVNVDEFLQVQHLKLINTSACCMWFMSMPQFIPYRNCSLYIVLYILDIYGLKWFLIHWANRLSDMYDRLWYFVYDTIFLLDYIHKVNYPIKLLSWSFTRLCDVFNSVYKDTSQCDAN